MRHSETLHKFQLLYLQKGLIMAVCEVLENENGSILIAGSDAESMNFYLQSMIPFRVVYPPEFVI